MAEARQVLLVSPEKGAGTHWKAAFSKVGLPVRLTVAPGADEGISALRSERAEAVVIVHGPPAIDATAAAARFAEHCSVPIFALGIAPEAIGELLRIPTVAAAWPEASEPFRCVAGRAIARFGERRAPGESGGAAAVTETSLGIAIEMARSAALEAKNACQTVLQKSKELRETLKPADRPEALLEAIDTAGRVISLRLDTVVQCAQAAQGARIWVPLHDLLRSVVRILQSERSEFAPKLRLEAPKDQIEANIVSFSHALAMFLRGWAECYGADGGRLILATDNPQDRALSDQTPLSLALGASDKTVRLRVVGRGVAARGPEFEPGADLSKIDTVLPFGALREELHASGGRIAIGHGPSGEPVVAMAIPLYQEPAAEEPAEEIEEAAETARILLVDPEPVVRAMAERMLSQLGYQVTPANDGAEALGIYKEKPTEFDLVLLEAEYPEMTGVQTFHQMKAIRPDGLYVFSSSSPRAAADLLDAASGFSGFIPKPYKARQIGSALREILAGRTGA